MISIIAPKRPSKDDWIYCGKAPSSITLGFEGHIWLSPSKSLSVISAVEVAHDFNDLDKGPEYHLSISRRQQRCTSNEARFVLRIFNMEDAEEDNHVPGGFVRNFWMPVNENLIGHECRCKSEEAAIIEDKGDFVWRSLS